MKSLTLPSFYHYYFDKPPTSKLMGLKKDSINKLIDSVPAPISSFELTRGKTIYCDDIKYLVKDLTYPHSGLKRKWKLYETNSGKLQISGRFFEIHIQLIFSFPSFKSHCPKISENAKLI